MNKKMHLIAFSMAYVKTVEEGEKIGISCSPSVLKDNNENKTVAIPSLLMVGIDKESIKKEFCRLLDSLFEAVQGKNAAVVTSSDDEEYNKYGFKF